MMQQINLGWLHTPVKAKHTRELQYVQGMSQIIMYKNPEITEYQPDQVLEDVWLITDIT